MDDLTLEYFTYYPASKEVRTLASSILEERKAKQRAMDATVGPTLGDWRKQQDEVNRLSAENDRLRGWLELIEGGDHPCTDAQQLRQWAYEAITLGHEVPK
ncbi:MAG: hypothetical protein WC551_11675 [Patescibacteria group bacterium]